MDLFGAPRLKRLLETAGFETRVLRAQGETSRHEDWIAEQEDRGIEVLVTDPDWSVPGSTS